MKINSINGWSQNYIAQKNSQGSYAETFSKVLDNLKNGRPANYDQEAMSSQKTQTMTQILSDGSTLITVFDENGKIISQSKTAAVIQQENPHLIGNRVEGNFGLGELTN